MPNKDTFNIPEIGNIVKRYLRDSRVSVDPFARNKKWATYTNDLNPKTSAEYHMDVLDFLLLLVEREVQADLVIFDPPYSPTQLKRAYEDIGRTMNGQDAWRTSGWGKEKDVIDNLLTIGGIVICLGWDSSGMGVKRGYEFVEGLMCYHGGGRNDTIVTIERKTMHQPTLL